MAKINGETVKELVIRNSSSDVLGTLSITDDNSGMEDMFIPEEISVTWQRKGLDSSGAETNVTNRLSTVEFIPAPGGEVTVTPGENLRFSLRFYAGSTTDTFTGMTDWITERYSFTPEVGTYFRVCVSLIANTTIQVSQGDNMSIVRYIFTDKTLTLENKAADAKAVGDRLNDVNNFFLSSGEGEIDVTWVQGSITADTGAGGSHTTRIHTTEYYRLSSGTFTISAPDTMKFSYRIYSGSAYTTYIADESLLVWETGTKTYSVAPGRYIRFVAAYSADGTITPDAGADVDLTYQKTAMDEIADDLDVVSTVTNVVATWIQGNIDPDTGNGGSHTTRIHTTEYYLLESNAVTITAPETMKFGIRVYATPVYSSYIKAESSTTWFTGSKKFEVASGRYLRFVAALTSDNVIDPSAGANVKMTYRKANTVSSSTDVIARNNPNDMLVKLQQLKQPTRTGSSSYARTPLCLLHFSDIHGDSVCLQNICDFANHYNAYIDDIIHTGDTMQTSAGPEPIFWRNIPEASRILNVIGNHDTLLDENWYGMTMSNSYDKFFKNHIENWGVTYTVNKTFYYKDYTTQKVRLIVLDNMHQTSEQLSWFQSTLDSARTGSYHVIVALHCMAHWLFDSYDTPWDDKQLVPTYKNNFVYRGTVPKDTSSATSTDYPNFPWNISDDYATAVDSFIDAGGEFICWIHGHTHFKMLAKLHTHPRQLDVAVGEAGAPDYARSYAYGRVRGTKSEDNFNLIGIDTYSRILRIAKVGVDYDRYMRHADTIGYDYGTREVIGLNTAVVG